MKHETLFVELRPDLEALAGALFEFSEGCLREIGTLIPHGAVLTEQGKVEIVGAVPDGDREWSTPTEVLLVLFHSLRALAEERALRAIGVVEVGTVNSESPRATRAIRVLVEHRRGLCVAVYKPFKRKGRRHTFGAVFLSPAEPEVGAWREGGT